MRMRPAVLAACALLVSACDLGPEPPLTIEIDGMNFTLSVIDRYFFVDTCPVTFTARASGEGEARAIWTDVEIIRVYPTVERYALSTSDFFGNQGLYAGEEYEVTDDFSVLELPARIVIRATYEYEGESRTVGHAFTCFKGER